MTVAALICGFGFVGCGDEGAGVEPAAEPRPARPSLAARRAMADPGSAATAVVRYWRSIQREALPLSLSLYAPSVIEAVGLDDFAGMLSAQRATVSNMRLNVIGYDSVGDGRLVTAEALPPIGPKVVHSFYVRRQDDRWRVVYDTLAGAAIGPYVQTQTQRGINPNARQLSTRAIRAGDIAAAVYRRASLSFGRPAQR